MAPEAQPHDDASGDVSTLRVARVYAEALLKAAGKQEQGDAVGEALDSLVADIFGAEPRVEAFLASPAVPRKAKAPVLLQVFGDRANEVFTNFLLVLNNHGRLDLLRPIRAAYHALLDEQARRVRVQVRSAVPLADEQRRQLQAQLRDRFHLEPVLQEGVDPELLGGLTVQVGDLVYDASLRSRLQDIRNQILTRSSHEIQRWRDRFRTDAGD